MEEALASKLFCGIGIPIAAVTGRCRGGLCD
jgi:hypothetical protein